MMIEDREELIKMYDAECKRILSNKYVIANILEAIIPEYKGLSFEKILSLIEDGDMSSKYIKGLPTKDKKRYEGDIDFDVLFTTLEEQSKKELGFYINLEAQNSIHEKYQMINRAQYYASRLVSGQKNITFTHSDYDKIRKVYSIWVLPYSTKEKENKIEFITLRDQNNADNVINSFTNIVFIHLNRNGKFETNINKNIFEMLSLLFHPSLKEKEHTSKILEDKYSIMKEKEEDEQVCNLGEYLVYTGEQKGIALGKTMGKIDAAISFIQDGMPKEKVFKILNLSENLKMQVLDKLK